MRARLFCRVGELSGTDHPVVGETTIGRGSQNDFVLDSSGISERHARIRWDEEVGCWVLEDLGSTNGTELDGLTVRRPLRLDRLHVITFARSCSFIFQDLEAYGAAAEKEHREARQPGAVVPVDSVGEDPGATTGTVVGQILEVPLLDDSEGGTGIHEGIVIPPGGLGTRPEQAPPPFRLEVEAKGEWRRFPLAPGENLVGRAEAEVTIETPDISRRHARLTVRLDEVVLEDLGSTNGTFYQGIRIQTALPVQVGAEITFGGTRARLVRE